jgi:hypothetical protein
VLVWRGEAVYGRDVPVDHTYRYDPVAERWSTLPRDPLPAVHTRGGDTGGAWTGREALFWGMEGVVAWNPATNRWRTAAAPPHGHDHRAVWTGAEAVFVLDGLAYDPATDRWRTIAPPPSGLAHSINTDGDVMVVLDRKIVVVGEGSGVYDPTADTWRDTGPVADEQPGVLAGGWDGFTALVFPADGQAVAVESFMSKARVLSRDGGRWVDAPDLVPPVHPSESSPRVAVLDGGGLVVSHGGQVAYRPPGGPWTQATESETGPMVAAGDRVYSVVPRNDRTALRVFTP